MIYPSTRRSFYVAVSRNGHIRDGWSWEIRRRRRPMGVKLRESGYRSHRAAYLAGKNALEDFLNGLAAGSRL
jgi:hypothetical protein